MRARASAALALAALAACALLAGLSGASFTDTTENPQAVSAVTDFLAPTAGASVVAGSTGGQVGYVTTGGTYYVYANVSDPGNPPSGIASVKADVSSITGKQTAVPLVAGSYTVGGVSYEYRSAALEATSGAGSKSYSLALADSAGNSRSQSFNATVTAPFKGSGFDTANVANGTQGKAEKGDIVTYSFNNAPNPASIVSGWDGTGTKSVTVSITDNGAADGLSVSGATIGGVVLNGDFTEGATTFSASSMSLNGSTVTIVLGTVSGNAKTDTNKRQPVWTPSGSNTDLAGSACSTATVNGANGKQF
jgi:hypothetical protein